MESKFCLVIRACNSQTKLTYQVQSVQTPDACTVCGSRLTYFILNCEAHLKYKKKQLCQFSFYPTQKVV